MKLTVKKIQLNELLSYSKSDEFKSFETIPISELRIQSYLNNPNAHPSDVVLLLGFIENKLVAFRSLFADNIKSENKTIRFGWCSGNWVHPDYRRKGYSEVLLKEAYTAWNGKLMFTNYAPNSEQLYIKSGWFTTIHQFKGARVYLYAKIQKIRPAKNSFKKPFYVLLDTCISLIASTRIGLYKPIEVKSVRFTALPFPDKECFDFDKTNHLKPVFLRNENELKWIFQFPWLNSDKNDEHQNYPFSSFAWSFKYYTFKIHRKNTLAGYFIFSVRDGFLKTLHFSYSQDVQYAIVKFLKEFCISNKIEVLQTYNSSFASYLIANKFPFLHAKQYGQKIYSTFAAKITKNQVFQDGDGDVFFT